MHERVRSCKNRRTSCRRALTLQSAATILSLVSQLRSACAADERVVRETAPTATYGRLHTHHPIHHCCVGNECSGGSKFAVVTSLRSPEYMFGLRELSCSLNKTNPDLPLIIVGATGDLNASLYNEIRILGEYRELEDLRYPNNFDEDSRFSLNWIKLRLWQWEEYDGLLVIDADTIVRGDLTHLFNLPTDFAWAHYNGPEGYDYNRGGLIMMRPCLSIYHAMMYLTDTHEQYQYRSTFAEQDFLTWFFRYTALILPLRYNLNFGYVDSKGHGPGGTSAILLHFADADAKQQLFHAKSEDRAWPFLCRQSKNASVSSHSNLVS